MALNPPAPPPHELDTPDWLKQFYPDDLFSSSKSPVRSRPFVTLTYAQSLDGKIAGKDGKQIVLSGAESMAMTHRMRELHDSILVGIGTILSDNPQLNARIPELLPLSSQPQPIVLDSTLKMPRDSKLVLNAARGIGKYPVVVGVGGQEETIGFQAIAIQKRKEELKKVGIQVYEYVPEQGTRKIDLRTLFGLPSSSGFKIPFGNSLMIEGGAAVISSSLASPGLVDLVVITVAPVLVGEGVSVISVEDGFVPPHLKYLGSRTFGQDTVIVCQPQPVDT